MIYDFPTITTITIVVFQALLAYMQARTNSSIADLKVYMHEHFIARDELRPIPQRQGIGAY